MIRFIVTFGQEHAHRINNYTFDKDSVAIVEAMDINEAQRIALDIFNKEFFIVRSEKNFDKEGYIKYFPRGKHSAMCGDDNE